MNYNEDTRGVWADGQERIKSKGLTGPGSNWRDTIETAARSYFRHFPWRASSCISVIVLRFRFEVNCTIFIPSRSQLVALLYTIVLKCVTCWTPARISLRQDGSLGRFLIGLDCLDAWP